ncbi:MAG: site-specific integrase [Pirellulales bacterium]|nr:site-specific integrase [Pirellulales bacterium]
MTKESRAHSRKKSTSFRIGKVRALLRGRIWYLCYREHGQRRQPRVGPDRDTARQAASQIAAQLEVGAPSLLGFEPLSIPELRDRWLTQHEFVRRSSLPTIRRYRAATEHLLNFVSGQGHLRYASDFRPADAEQFVRYLRLLNVAPNGHRCARKRPLLDNGIVYILETCCTLFNYAARHRHLSPYAENPFRTLEISRIPIENARPIDIFDEDTERAFLDACDHWQFPLFLTMFCLGLRPGELVHLLLPEDLDLTGGWLHVRNKPKLGWQVKTRSERDLPLIPELVAVLRQILAGRNSGPVFRQRRCSAGYEPPLAWSARAQLEQEVVQRARSMECEGSSDQERKAMAAETVWRDLGALQVDWVRIEFMKLTAAILRPELTAPKLLRHSFATLLQDANVDPLIRKELMGHSTAEFSSSAQGLGMTTVYTHTRPETKRRQLTAALAVRPAVELARRWLSIEHHAADEEMAIDRDVSTSVAVAAVDPLVIGGTL